MVCVFYFADFGYRVVFLSIEQLDHGCNSVSSSVPRGCLERPEAAGAEELLA